MDTRINEPRHFGEVLDVSQGHWNSANQKYSDLHSKNRIRNSLMGHPSTLPTLMFALYEHKKGRPSLVDDYVENMNYTTGETKIKQLIEAMRLEYNPSKEKDISGNSMSRPIGHSKKLDDYRFKLNPVNGELASNYI